MSSKMAVCCPAGSAPVRFSSRMTWLSVGEEDAMRAVAAVLGEERLTVEMEAGRDLSLAEAVALALAVQPSQPEAVAAEPPPVDPFGLSAREREVLQLLIEGSTNQEIAEALFISRRTAGTHVTNIFGKLGVNSRAAAVAVAFSNGLTDR